MDKNEVKYIISKNSSKAKEQLEQVKRINNPETRKRDAELAYNYHLKNLEQVTPYYESYELWKEGVNLSEYGNAVSELKNLQGKEIQTNQRQNQTNRLSHCSQCNKKSSLYHFIWDKRTKKLVKSYNNATDSNNEWVFCNQSCFNDWYKKWWSSFEDELKNFTCKNCKNKFQVEREYKRGKEITKNYDCCSQECLNSWNQNNSKEQNTEIICHQCNKFFSGQYWYKTNPRESLIHKFCSNNCCNTYWNKKTCSGSGCSTLLTSEETCYCATCLKKNDEALKNLEKNQQDINNMVGDFQNGLNDYVENQRDNADKGNISNSNHAIERERERESKLLSDSNNYVLKSCN